MTTGPEAATPMPLVRVRARLDLGPVVARLEELGGGLAVEHALVMATARALARHPALRSGATDALALVQIAAHGTTLAQIPDAAALRLDQVRRRVDKTRKRLAGGAIAGVDLADTGFAVVCLNRTPADGLDPAPVPPHVAVLGTGPVIEEAVVRDGALRIAPVLHVALAAERGAVGETEAADFLADLAEELDRAEAWEPPPRLDPQMEEVLLWYARRSDVIRPVSDLTPAQAREQARWSFTDLWNVDAPPLASVEDRQLPGPRGPLTVRVYDPGLPRPAPCVVYVHGGGWVLCDLDSHDGVCRRLALAGHARVVAVEYGLAPENKFPAPLEDCLAAIRWLAAHGEEWGIDPSRLALAGDSAGANLALSCCLALRDAGGPAVRCALLFYGAYGPALDAPSMADYGDGSFLLSTADMRWFAGHHLGGTGRMMDPLAWPLLADLAGLPPLYITAAEFDPLLDDSRRLAGRLEDAGVPHELVIWRGVIHACLHMTSMVDQVAGLYEQIGRALRRLMED